MLLTGRLSGWRSKARFFCFENIESNQIVGRLTAFSIRGINLAYMFKLGMDYMPKTTMVAKEQLIEIESQKVLVNCNASNYLLARRYPEQAFVSLIGLLHQSYPELEFYFTGSKDECAYVEEIVREMKAREIKARNMAGKWNLEQLCDELVVSRLFITCDSGPLHLAATLGVPTLAIWGPTQFEQFGYANLPQLKNGSLHLPCAPCLIHPHAQVLKACGGEITCMKSLSVEILFNKAKEALDENTTFRKVKVLPGMMVKKEGPLQYNPL